LLLPCFWKVISEEEASPQSIFYSAERKIWSQKQPLPIKGCSLRLIKMAHLLGDDEIRAGIAKGRDDLRQYLEQAKKPVKYEHAYRDLMAANGESHT
jgi:hypothetical protein